MIEQFPLNIVFFDLELLILFLIISIKTILIQFKGISKKTWITLSLVVFISFILIFSLPRIYIGSTYREVQAAKNIVVRGEPMNCMYVDYNVLKCQKFDYILGLPIILSIVFSIFGMSPTIAINTISIFGWLSILLIFLLSYLFFKDEKVALISSFILALSPLHVFLSSTISDYTVANFFVMLTFIGLLTYVRTNDIKVLIFSLLSLAFLGQLLEVLIFFSIPYFLVVYKKDRLNKRFLVSLLIFLIFILPMLFQHLLFGLMLSLRGFISYFNLPMFYHLLFFSFIGIYFLAIEKRRKDLLFLLEVTIIPLLLVFFYSVFYFSYFLLLYPGIILLTSYGIRKILEEYGKTPFILILLIYVIIFSYTYYDISSGGFTNKYIKETEIAGNINMLVPKDCYVFTFYPGMLRSTSDVKTISLDDENIKKVYDDIIKRSNCVFFFCDIRCNNQRLCKKNYACTLFKKSLKANGISPEIKLYRIK